MGERRRKEERKWSAIVFVSDGEQETKQRCLSKFTK